MRRGLDPIEPERCQCGRQPASDRVVDSLCARPRRPAIPEAAHIGRLGHADGKEIRLDQQNRAARSSARDDVRDCRVRVRHVMEHRASRHEVEVGRSDRARAPALWWSSLYSGTTRRMADAVAFAAHERRTQPFRQPRYGNQSLMSTASAPGWGSWNFNPIVIAALLAAAVIYARVYRRAERRASSSKPGIGHWLPYGAGLFAIAIALLSPLDEIGDHYLLSAHMMQHVLL